MAGEYCTITDPHTDTTRNWQSSSIHTPAIFSVATFILVLLETTIWGTDTGKDIAESVVVMNLSKEANQALCRDVKYKISLVLEHALKFMRHAKRTILSSQDISNSLEGAGSGTGERESESKKRAGEREKKRGERASRY